LIERQSYFNKDQDHNVPFKANILAAIQKIQVSLGCSGYEFKFSQQGEVSIVELILCSKAPIKTIQLWLIPCDLRLLCHLDSAYCLGLDEQYITNFAQEFPSPGWLNTSLKILCKPLYPIKNICHPALIMGKDSALCEHVGYHLKTLHGSYVEFQNPIGIHPLSLLRVDCNFGLFRLGLLEWTGYKGYHGLEERGLFLCSDVHQDNHAKAKDKSITTFSCTHGKGRKSNRFTPLKLTNVYPRSQEEGASPNPR